MSVFSKPWMVSDNLRDFFREGYLGTDENELKSELTSLFERNISTISILLKLFYIYIRVNRLQEKIYFFPDNRMNLFFGQDFEDISTAISEIILHGGPYSPNGIERTFDPERIRLGNLQLLIDINLARRNGEKKLLLIINGITYLSDPLKTPLLDSELDHDVQLNEKLSSELIAVTNWYDTTFV